MTLVTLDACSGIGGFRLAAESLPVDSEARLIAETDPYAVRAYESISPAVVNIGDLSEPERILDEHADALGAINAVFAGLPCQPHSLMGNRLGLDDSRGALFYPFAKILDFITPDLVIMENVRAIKSVNCGQLFSDMQIRLAQLGLNVRVWTLNASDYGVPQTRRRTFVVGSRWSLPDAPPPAAASRHHATTWHALEREVEERYYLSERIKPTILKDTHKGYSRPARINLLTARPLTRTMHKMHRASQDNYYSDDFIQGEFARGADQVEHGAHGADRIRRITPREAFRFQGLSESQIDHVIDSGLSDTRLYMAAGNAVPVPMAAAVIRHATREMPR